MLCCCACQPAASACSCGAALEERPRAHSNSRRRGAPLRPGAGHALTQLRGLSAPDQEDTIIHYGTVCREGWRAASFFGLCHNISFKPHVRHPCT